MTSLNSKECKPATSHWTRMTRVLGTEDKKKKCLPFTPVTSFLDVNAFRRDVIVLILQSNSAFFFLLLSTVSGSSILMDSSGEKNKKIIGNEGIRFLERNRKPGLAGRHLPFRARAWAVLNFSRGSHSSFYIFSQVQNLFLPILPLKKCFLPFSERHFLDTPLRSFRKGLSLILPMLPREMGHVCVLKKKNHTYG